MLTKSPRKCNKKTEMKPGVISQSVIPAIARQRQEVVKFKVSLGYIVRTCFEEPKQTDL
jgi:hypothetical protein